MTKIRVLPRSHSRSLDGAGRAQVAAEPVRRIATATSPFSTVLILFLLAGCDSSPATTSGTPLGPQGVAFVTETAEAETPHQLTTTGLDHSGDAPLQKKTTPLDSGSLEPVATPDLSGLIPTNQGAPADSTKNTSESLVRLQEPDKDGVRSLSFKILASFEYEVIDPLEMLSGDQREIANEIPSSIEELSGERVKVDGYLMPTIFESGRVQEFLLTRSYITCCFGDVLNMNEVIDCDIEKDLEVSYFLSGQPVTVTGWFEVGEKKSEFGYVESIYRMIVEKVEERW